jgi:hypothetical protein
MRRRDIFPSWRATKPMLGASSEPFYMTDEESVEHTHILLQKTIFIQFFFPNFHVLLDGTIFAPFSITTTMIVFREHVAQRIVVWRVDLSISS